MTTQVSISPRAWAELGLLALFWGGTFLTVKIAQAEVPYLTIVLHRVGWAALLLWGVVLVRRLEVPRNPMIWFAFFVMGALNNVIPFSLQSWSQLHIESGLTAILNSITAVFGVLFAAILLADERLTMRKFIGVALGFLGVSMAIGLSALANLDLRSMAQIAVLASGISYAFAAIWARTQLKGLNPVVAATGMLTGSTVIMIPIVLFYEGTPSFSLSINTWAAIGYYTVFATFFAYLLYYRVLAMAGAGNLMLVTLLVPPIAIILGAVFLGEALPLRAYGGFLVLALGLLIIDGRILRLLR